MRPKVSCREILSKDLVGVVALLQRGFAERQLTYWERGLQRMQAHATPLGFPKYGYLLEANDTAVGVVLIIFSCVTVAERIDLRGNVASWYVEPMFRSYASMLTSHAFARKDVTYLNISPARRTWPILEAQGFERFCTGQFLALAALSGRPWAACVQTISSDIEPGDDLSLSDIALLSTHAKYGCISVTCTAQRRRAPFVFMRCWHRWKVGSLPYALLVHCRSLEEFIKYAGPLGRFLVWRGMPMVFIDSDGPIPGLIGKPIDMGPKFYRGPSRPHFGDLAYTEQVFFGP